MFYGPLEELQFDHTIWRWVGQVKLMKYTTKQGRKMSKPNKKLVYNTPEL